MEQDIIKKVEDALSDITGKELPLTFDSLRLELEKYIKEYEGKLEESEKAVKQKTQLLRYWKEEEVTLQQKLKTDLSEEERKIFLKELEMAQSQLSSLGQYLELNLALSYYYTEKILPQLKEKLSLINSTLTELRNK